MNVEVEAGGRRRAVRIERRRNEWIAIVDGRAVAATVTEVGGGWSLLIGTAPGADGPGDDGGHAESAFSRTGDGAHVESGFSRTGDGAHVESAFSRTDAGATRSRRSFEVSFSPHGDEGTIVWVNGVPVPIAVADPRARFRHRNRHSGTAASAARAIVAPMPGRVVKVLVEHGQTVVERQPVVVVEAMKMENELRAPRAGTVTAVHVTEGMSVEAHAVLVVLE